MKAPPTQQIRLDRPGSGVEKSIPGSLFAIETQFSEEGSNKKAPGHQVCDLFPKIVALRDRTIGPAETRIIEQDPMSATQQLTSEDQELIQSIFDRIAADLGMIINRTVDVAECRAERLRYRAADEGSIHISFRLGVRIDGVNQQGCFLLPLAEAVSVAGYLMMMSDEEVVEYRSRVTLDTAMKEALLEVGNFIAGACDAVLRPSLPEGASIRSEGCQGVRAGVRPALEYEEGEDLIIGHATGRIDEFPEFPLIVMLPDRVTK